MELLDEQFLEAKKILKILEKKYKIDEKIFDDFEKNKKIYITEDNKLYEIKNKKILKIIEDIEKKEEILVYHCILENEFLLNFLYISSDEKNWENDESFLYLNLFKVIEVNLNSGDNYIEKEVEIISANNMLKIMLECSDEKLNINIIAQKNIKVLNEYPNLVNYRYTYKKKFKNYLEELKKLQVDFNNLENNFFNDSDEIKSVINILKEKRYSDIFEKYLEEIKREDKEGLPENYFIYKNFSIKSNVIKDNFLLINEGITTIMKSIEKGNIRIELIDLIRDIENLLKRIRKVYEIYAIYLIEEGKVDTYKKYIYLFDKYNDIFQKISKNLREMKKEKKDLFL